MPRATPDSEIEGRRFGRLVAKSRSENVKEKRVWMCACDCGGSKVILLASLLNGATQSCGCMKREQSRERKFATVHGECHKTPEHNSWSSMLARCRNPNHDAYPNYGGRGITVCDQWAGPGGYEQFLSDMGRRPSRGWSLDRIDPNKGYSLENCRWATASRQLRNRRVSIMIEYRGETLCMADWADRSPVDYATFGYRRRNGWPMEKIMSTPPRRISR